MLATGAKDDSEIKAALHEVLLESKSISELKHEQEFARLEFLSGKDVFAVLPTAFGKSLIYQLAPLVLSVKVSSHASIVRSSDRVTRPRTAAH